MELSLRGHAAIVTGGSRGIGACIVRELASEGVRVAVCARESTELAALEAEMRRDGHVCDAIPVDVLDGMAVTDAVDRAARLLGGIDILVNNVGGAIRFAGFEELSDDDWLRTYEFNVLSLVRFTRAALPHLRVANLRRIINLSSISALQPGHYNPHYAATKAAVVNVSKHLSVLLAKDGILVNTICPGPVHSESWRENVRRVAAANHIGFEEAWVGIEKEEAAKIPLGVIGEGEEVAAAVAFLASPRSSWTTGSCFHLNGGKLQAAI